MNREVHVLVLREAGGFRRPTHPVSAGFLRAFRHWAWPRFDAGLVENLVNPRHMFTKKLLS
jgi:hypothetical protein